VTDADIDKMAQAIVDTIEMATEPLHERIKHLEQLQKRPTEVRIVREAQSGDTSDLHQRVKALEDKPPAPRWVGVWRAANEYQPGDLVTRSGALWLCARPTAVKPGAADSGWTLIVKAGAYGTAGDE
jgi:hypothetical protein